ncbi:hypothetical protein ACO0QE_003866 [Hanseniaspora vineae]
MLKAPLRSQRLLYTQVARMSSQTTLDPNRCTDGPICQQIIAKLQKGDPSSTISSANISKLEIYNDSYKHVAHAAQKNLPNKIESHIRLVIVSDGFKRMPVVKRHKLIYSLLAEELARDVHALQLTLKTEEEYKKLSA